ncbi:MAG: alanine racemase [Acidimicrobiales bacterium]
MRPVWADIDLGAVSRNVARLAAVAAPATLYAVVKADGYGHGAVPVARAALTGGAQGLAVALVAEGVALRKAGIDAPVLVLSEASTEDLPALVDHRLDATVYTSEGIASLAAAARNGGRGADDAVAVHLKVDTGMHRVGAAPVDAVDLARSVIDAEGLALAALCTHCAVADEPDNPFTAGQIDRFEDVVTDIRSAGIDVARTHAANTAATLAWPQARLDMVRCGIGIYGLAPSPALADRIEWEPALSLRAEVSFVKRVAAGEGVSYGLRYRPGRETTIATVPIGYADGVPRRLSAVGGRALVGGVARPIAGTVTMDQLLLDCGDDPVAIGDEVVLLGRQGDATIAAADWAEGLDTITYEIVCGIGPRVPRRYQESPS